MFRRFSINFAIFSMLLDALIVLGAMLSMLSVRLHINDLDFIQFMPAEYTYPKALYIFFPLVWVLVLASFLIYDGKKHNRVVDEFSTLTTASIVAAAAQAGILYLSYRSFSRALFLLIVLASFLGCAFWRVIARLIFRMRKEYLNIKRKLLIIGLSTEIERINNSFKQRPNDSISSVFQFDLQTILNEDGGKETKFQIVNKKIHQMIAEEQISDVILALPRDEAGWIEAIVTRLDDFPIGIWVALDFLDLSMSEARVENLAGLPFLDLRAPALDETSRIVKRAFDLVFGSLAMLLSLPMQLLTALCVLLIDGRPVFFLQNRVGENGKLFKIIKFRTMVKNAEKKQVLKFDQDGSPLHKTSDDPRVTRLGKFLRRFSLDELPQLLNVLKGEMSLVGPRPELPYLVENYEHWQRRRLSVPPGITGWWQVNGRSERVMHLNTEDDIYYVENYSIWLDLRIIIKTFWIVLIGRGSF